MLLVNFGGPRCREEIAPFLTELLTDQDVIQTRYPAFFHRWLFGRIARKRAIKVAHDYELIGGKSPIFFDTEAIARTLDAHAFHRYLPSMHAPSLQALEDSTAEEIRVLPLFPQFSFTTTGSIARFLFKRLSSRALSKLRWVRSYPDHPAFIIPFTKLIRRFLEEQKLAEEEIVLLFSAHGLPASYVDSYASECIRSFEALKAAFPKALARLCYQSKFGPGEWLRPYTEEACREICNWNEGRPHVVFIPLSFTSDHIETLFEIEYQYLPLIRERGLMAYRCPALNLDEEWLASMPALLTEFVETKALIR